jgi:hypothetical protein
LLASLSSVKIFSGRLRQDQEKEANIAKGDFKWRCTQNRCPMSGGLYEAI